MSGGGDKFCVDCAHHAKYVDSDASGYVDACARPLSDRRHFVTGEFADKLDILCRAERRHDRTPFTRRLRCGPSARFFEERH